MPGKWQAAAAAKRDQVNGLIPKEWLIKDPPSNEQQKDVTGKYIQQFLNEREIEITETDAVGVASHTVAGQWKAIDVAKAFAHRAALAHQLVRGFTAIRVSNEH